VNMFKSVSMYVHKHKKARGLSLCILCAYISVYVCLSVSVSVCMSVSVYLCMYDRAIDISEICLSGLSLSLQSLSTLFATSFRHYGFQMSRLFLCKRALHKKSAKQKNSCQAGLLVVCI